MVHSDTQPAGYDANVGDLHIGRFELATSSQSYDGLLAFATVYAKTLSQSEIQKLADDSDALVRLAPRQVAVSSPQGVDGPYRVERQTIHVPGSTRQEVFVPGSRRQDVYVPGSQRETVVI